MKCKSLLTSNAKHVKTWIKTRVATFQKANLATILNLMFEWLIYDEFIVI